MVATLNPPEITSCPCAEAQGHEQVLLLVLEHAMGRLADGLTIAN